MSHELALQKALIAHLRTDAALQALVGDRVWDAAPEAPGFPHMLIGRAESRPLAADGGGMEHLLTLTVVSRFHGTEEVKAIVAATRLRLADAGLQTDGVRVASLGVRFSDVWPSSGGQRVFAALRVRAVTEDV